MKQPIRRVLVVDDEPAVRGMLTVTLEMAGFEVIEAESASSALNEIADSIPDLMLIDWMMPHSINSVDRTGGRKRKDHRSRGG